MAICTSSSPTLPTSIPLHPSPPPPKHSPLQAAQMVVQQPTSMDDALTTSASTSPHAIFMGRSAACSSSAAAASTLMLAEMALFVEHVRPKSPEYVGEEVRRGRRRKRRRSRRRGSPENLMDKSCSDGLLVGVGSNWTTCNLSAGEEAECALCVKEGERLEAARSRLREIEKKDPTMSQWANAVGMRKPTLEMALGRVRECKNRITRSYRRLVVSIATPYCGRGLTLHDLIQEGCMGLLRGAERFDRSKGNKLSTYVYWWIKQAIVKAVATKSRIVRLPGSMQGAMAKVAEANAVLNERLGRLPTHEEIANMVGICEKRVRVICERSRAPLSLDQPMSDRGSITIKEIFPGPDGLTPEAMVARKMMKLEVSRLLESLTEREEQVVRLYFGLDGETAKSCEEIGRVVSLSRERVRQIRDGAMLKLQESGRRGELKENIMYIT